MPPSTGTTAPLVNAPARLARNTTAPTMSSGVPIRWRGTWAETSARISSVSRRYAIIFDGEVASSIELLERLARSDRARQSMIRHAFRFYMGRNEMLSDAQTLIDAERVYIESGGSFEAAIVSLLTSDSFLYRMDLED